MKGEDQGGEGQAWDECEVGLAGEVRPAPRGQERLREAAKLGFSVAVVPQANAPKKPIEGLTVHGVERIEQAMDVVRGL